MNVLTTEKLAPLPDQPADLSWPTADWPTGDLPPETDKKRLMKLMDHAFAAQAPADLGETHAVVVIKGGKLVHEQYWTGFGPEVTCPSWSKGKSITHALVGILAGDGKMDIHAPADVPEWQDPADPRHAITLDQLLRMSSGLAFREDYVPDHPSDVIEMLWGAGKEDTAHFAASFPLEHEPGTYWSYASGTTNIVSRAAARAANLSGAEFESFMRRRLLHRFVFLLLHTTGLRPVRTSLSSRRCLGGAAAPSRGMGRLCPYTNLAAAGRRGRPLRCPLVARDRGTGQLFRQWLRGAIHGCRA